MRIALWIAVLLAAFAVAWLVQDRWAQARRDERDAAWQRPSGDTGPGNAGDLPEGFSRAVVGAPSGSPPVTPPPPARPAPRASRETTAPTEARTYRVAKGETLSQICAVVYGTARAEIVQALARRNGLSKPEALRAGQDIVLPPLAELRAPPR